jgi:hypothetical protein
VPAAFAKGFSIGAAKTLTVNTATTSFTAKADGAGTLELAGPVTAAAITGTGKVQFTNAPLAFAAGSASFANTGLTVFAGAVSFADGASFGGPVVFKGDVTLTDGTAAFGNDVFFADTKKITLTAAASIISLAPAAELAHGAATGNNSMPAAHSAIIANFSDAPVTLTPAAGAALTFGANGAKSITQSGAGGHGITIAGEASLVPSATYTAASESGKAGTLAAGIGAILNIGAGLPAGLPDGTVGEGIDNADGTSSKLVLTGAAADSAALLKGAGSVIAGGTTIAGGTGGWEAVAADITVAADSISATAAPATPITVDGVAITLASDKGTVTLTGGATPGTLALKGGSTAGSLVADSSKTDTVSTVTGVTLEPSAGSGGTDATVTGTGIVLKAGAADVSGASAAAGTVGGGNATPGNNAAIIGPADGNDPAIATGWKVKAASA